MDLFTGNSYHHEIETVPLTAMWPFTEPPFIYCLLHRIPASFVTSPQAIPVEVALEHI